MNLCYGNFIKTFFCLQLWRVMFSQEESKHFLTSFVALTLVSPDIFNVHARLKCCDDRFASNPQYIFQSLDWIERTAIAASIHFADRKQY